MEKPEVHGELLQIMRQTGQIIEGDSNKRVMISPEDLIAAGIRTPEEQAGLEADAAKARENVVDLNEFKQKKESRVQPREIREEDRAGEFAAITPEMIAADAAQRDKQSELAERFEGGKAGMISPEELIEAGIRTPEEQAELAEAKAKAKEVAENKTVVDMPAVKKVERTGPLPGSESPAGMHEALTPEDIEAYKKEEEAEEAKKNPPKRKGFMGKLKGWFGG